MLSEPHLHGTPHICMPHSAQEARSRELHLDAERVVNSEMASAAKPAAPAADGGGDPFAAALAERKPYYEKRIQLFLQYQERAKAALEAAKAANEPIAVTMPDGKQRQAVKGVTTPMDVAKEISPGLAKKVVVADVDGKPWDLTRPLEGDCALKLFSFDDPEGKDVRSRACGAVGARPRACRAQQQRRSTRTDATSNSSSRTAAILDRGGLTWRRARSAGLLAPCLVQAYWHSSAHALGQALELEFGVDLTIGPSLEEGFYYDCFMGDKVRARTLGWQRCCPSWGTACSALGGERAA